MKKRSYLLFAIFLVMAMAIASLAQEPPAPTKGTILRPPSALGNLPVPAKVRTPLYVRIPTNNVRFSSLAVNGETPASLACIYGLVTPTNGCPNNGTILPTGGAKAIAVIEYGTYSNVQNDLNTFSAEFGLPSTTIIQQCYPGPSCPANNGTGWDLEEALDVQYAHAMAPNAKIIVASFTDDPLADGAEDGAANYIVGHYGAGEVSNSWTYSGGEGWCGSGNCELSYDYYFQVNGIVFFASAGDSGAGPAYPSVSPNVVSAGGTAIIRDANGNFTGENCWWGSGGGVSQYEHSPSYQWIASGRTGPFRGMPDLASESDPNDGVDVYSSSYCGGWCIVGGTSVASPTLAGIVNQSGSFHTSTAAELTQAYNEYGVSTGGGYFNDVTIGSNGYTANIGWDMCTGIGSVRKPSGL